MKLIRLFDIILQVILLLIPLYILFADGKNEPIGYALIGLWQLFSFLMT